MLRLYCLCGVLLEHRLYKRTPCRCGPLDSHGVRPRSVVELRVCASDRQSTRTGRSSRQALLSGGHEVTACERVIGQDDSVNISCCVASVELTSSVLMILSTPNTMRMSEYHKEVSCTRCITWRFCRGCHVFHCHVGYFTAKCDVGYFTAT